MLKRTLLGLVVAAVCSTTGFAQTIVFNNTAGLTFDNSSPNDLSAVIGGETVDDFNLAAATTLTGVQWSGVYVPDALNGGDGVLAAADDNFEIRIYDDVGGAPGARAATFAVGGAVNRVAGAQANVGVGGAAVDTFDFSADINFNAAAGTTYWISVLNNTTNDPDNFNQLVVAAGGNAFGDLNPNDGVFAEQGFITDFRLVSAVPEPSSAILLALGLAGFAARRRR